MSNKNNIPIFKKWSSWYVFVITVLIVLIILFYWITKEFSK